MTMGLWLLAAAGIFFLLSVRAFWRRRIKRGISKFLTAAVFTVLAVSVYQTAKHLQTYFPVHFERDIAEIQIRVVEKGREMLVKDLVGGRSYRWEPRGTSWQLELRILDFHGICGITGWTEHYRLSRMQTYEPAQVADRSRGNAGRNDVIHDIQLQHKKKGWDVWRRARRLAEKRPDLEDEIKACIKAQTLTSSVLNMPDQGVYRASIDEDTLRIRKMPGKSRD